MSQKRQQREESTSFDERRPRKSPSFKSVVLEVMNLCKLQNLMEPVLEPLIRRVVKEEVDTALRKYIISMKRNCGKDKLHPSKAVNLRLRFTTAVSLPVFTGTRIEGEGGNNMEIALIDSFSGLVVSTGLGSTAKVEILVLEGDFDGDERENWTLEEFRNNTVREREGKKPLLIGDLIVTLKDGTGSISNVMFTDNSSWTRSRKFRLGARVLDNLGDVRIREARSEPFVVRDHRGELYKKHHPPSLSDEVWRLEKIGKDGAFHRRLRKERVNSVHDFLRLLFLDPTRLRNILGTGMSAKMWEVTVEHAQTCVLDKKLYSYGASQKSGVVFNLVGQVMGIFSNDHYVPSDKLSEAEKANACELVKAAFAYPENITAFDGGPSPNIPPESNITLVEPSIFAPDGIRSDYYASTTPDYMQSVFDDCLQGIVDLRSDRLLTYSGQISDGLLCDANGGFFSNEHLQYFETEDDINAFMPCCSSGPIDMGQKKGWNVLVSVIRWWCSIKRIVARKTRNGKSMRYHH